MSTRAEEIIARFTKDPDLKALILQYIQDFKAGTTSVDKIIGEHTSDPVLTAKIKERISAVRAGKHIANITAFGANNADHALDASEKANKHRGAIDHIVKQRHKK
jgi:hypothetical protein